MPNFFRCRAEGIAELELTDPKDAQLYERVVKEVREKCGPAQIAGKEPEFPNEPIICPGRKLLDDAEQSFRKFDRVLGVKGIPQAPEFV